MRDKRDRTGERERDRERECKVSAFGRGFVKVTSSGCERAEWHHKQAQALAT